MHAEAGAMAQWLRALTVPGDESSAPSSHTGQLATTCNSSSKSSDSILFWTLWEPMCTCSHTHTHIQTCVHTQEAQINKNKF